MSPSRSLRWDERGGPQHARVHSHDDHFIRESDLKWENDVRRMCRSSNVSWEVTDKVIQAHREKQEKKMRLRRGDASAEEIIIPKDEREHPVHREREREPVIRRDGRDDRNTELVQEVRVEKPSRSGTTTVPGLPPPATGLEFINGPPIHREVITHHRHIDHGFELALKTEEDPEEDRTEDEHEGRDAHGDEEEINIEGTSRSSSPSPSPTPAPEPHIIKGPAIHQEVITHHRHIDLGDSKVDRMVQLLETILQTLRDEVTVTPLNKSAGEADTKAGKSVEELQAAEQTTKAQKALAPPARKKVPRRGENQIRARDHAKVLS
ncbi:hypothetical protein GJ744_002223 [Endocarpon pusillum]|uniref:Uncharacterized protein n=1 Tax=Endocarpon pusillum TaxID=364733 RepID=A0A8H7AAH0_9EURO|nr:hypothetical protein GJ744_002223 [Endocarpon pusillum]